MKAKGEQLERLVAITNATPRECFEALISTNSFEDALEELKNNIKLRINSLKKGMIVTVDRPTYLPNQSKGIVTKVLFILKNNKTETLDVNGKSVKVHIQSEPIPILFLENTDVNLKSFNQSYLNKRCLIESLNAVRPATTREKEQYIKNKKTIYHEE